MKPFLTCQLLWLNFELRFMKPSLQNTNFCSDIWTIFNDMAHFKPYTGANIEYFLILEIWRNLKLAGVSCGCLKSKPKIFDKVFSAYKHKRYKLCQNWIHKHRQVFRNRKILPLYYLICVSADICDKVIN